MLVAAKMFACAKVAAVRKILASDQTAIALRIVVKKPAVVKKLVQEFVARKLATAKRPAA